MEFQPFDSSSKVVLTPMMAQYWQVKADHPHDLLFYRMGDFYELFHEDALVASKILGIALTRRGKTEGEDIPMCGVPFHSAETYIAKLIKKGHKVAICEQMESPEEARKRGAKGPLRRGVVRVITPGTLMEENLLPANRNNYLACLSLMNESNSKKDVFSPKKSVFGIALIDISTGEFLIESVDKNMLGATLARFLPSEIIVPDLYITSDKHNDVRRILEPILKQCTPLPKTRFNIQNAHERLLKFFNATTLDVFGNLPDECIMAAGVCLDYLYLTQKETLPQLGYPKFIRETECMHIDPATRKSLEITFTQKGDYQGSLLHTLDHTVTPMGGRLMASHLSAPLLDVDRINARLDCVSYFYNHNSARQDIRKILQKCPDGERAISRLVMQRGGPKDLGVLRQNLDCAENVARQLQEILAYDPHQSLDKWPDLLLQGNNLKKLLDQALKHDILPFLARDGNFIQDGYDVELDRLRNLKRNSKNLIQELQQKYNEETGIPNLKIKHNHILGYHIEISPSHIQKIPDYFIHRQSLSTCHRYTTIELSDLEKDLNNADESALIRELSIYAELLSYVQQEALALNDMFKTIAILDVVISHSTLARDQNYTRPLVDDSLAFHIDEGRHPVVEYVFQNTGHTFTANDCHIPENQPFWLMTGPNMGGKSTFLRQNAIIVIMAQMGMYVPAKKAHIGFVDRLSSRVGAFDDLAAGRSTFMVEMIETAGILHQSTLRSFVILDEIGRGTSTYDGLAIALAVTEHMYHHIRCRTLFATHYHELTRYQETMPLLGCLTVQVQPHGNDVVFLHKVTKGVADRSYGVYVAARAGLPKSVIARAQTVLQELEKQQHSLMQTETNTAMITQDTQTESTADLLLNQLVQLDLNQLTPKQALDCLYDIQNQYRKST